MVEEEKFFAWLDGELSPEEASHVERQVAADPQLLKLAEEHRAMASGLRAAFDPVLIAPVPEPMRTAATASAETNVVDLASKRQRLVRLFTTPVRQWAAMAATLVLGIAAGVVLDSAAPGSPVEVRDGQLYAAGSIHDILERQLASAGVQDGSRVGLTYRNESGAICRTFESLGASGVACRSEGSWQVRGLFAGPEETGEYRMASGTDPRLMELVESTMAGEPFDAAQEAEAKERGWR